MCKTGELNEICVNDFSGGGVHLEKKFTKHRLSNSCNLYGMGKASAAETFGTDVPNLRFTLKSPERAAKRQIVRSS